MVVPSLGGGPHTWNTCKKGKTTIFKLVALFDTHALRPSCGQQQMNPCHKYVSILNGNLNTFLGDVGAFPRWRTTHLEHLQKGNKLKRNTILKLVTVFDTHALRPSSGQQQINPCYK